MVNAAISGRPRARTGPSSRRAWALAAGARGTAAALTAAFVEGRVAGPRRPLWRRPRGLSEPPGGQGRPPRGLGARALLGGAPRRVLVPAPLRAADRARAARACRRGPPLLRRELLLGGLSGAAHAFRSGSSGSWRRTSGPVMKKHPHNGARGALWQPSLDPLRLRARTERAAAASGVVAPARRARARRVPDVHLANQRSGRRSMSTGGGRRHVRSGRTAPPWSSCVQASAAAAAAAAAPSGPGRGPAAAALASGLW